MHPADPQKSALTPFYFPCPIMFSVSQEKYEMCLRITGEAMEKLEVANKGQVSDTFLQFARDYITDAKHYAEKGDYATALEAIAYAHGFIDAGVLAGYFRIDGYHLGAL